MRCEDTFVGRQSLNVLPAPGKFHTSVIASEWSAAQQYLECLYNWTSVVKTVK